MNIATRRSTCTIALLAALAGCTHSGPRHDAAAAQAATPPPAQQSQERYSGYLVNYNDMKPVQTASGDIALRWVNPALKKGQYTAIIIEPVGFYPKPPRLAQASKAVMLKVAQYISEQAKRELGEDLKIVDQPGPGVLRWDAAITGVQVPATTGESTADSLPVAKIFEEKTAAAAPKPERMVVYLESRLLDSQSNKLVAKALRRGVGKPVPSGADSQTLFELTKPALDTWVKDAHAFVHQEIK